MTGSFTSRYLAFEPNKTFFLDFDNKTYLIESHPDLFTGVHYAIGETGAFTFYIGKQKFYPIMVTEKQFIRLNIIAHGLSRYATASMVQGETAAKTGALLTRLDHGQLPVHITPTARLMVEAISSNLPFPNSLVMRQLLKPALTNGLLKMLGPAGKPMFPLFHNTFAVIGVNGGEQVITTPAKIVVSLALGLLPGFNLDEAIGEIRKIAGADFEYEKLNPGEVRPEKPNMGLFETLCRILRETDPDGAPVPLMLTAFTDARLYNRLGIQTYGFQPVKLPPEIQLEKLVHAADERIPVDAVEFGADALYKLFQRFS